MALDHGVGDIELALTIDQHKTSADFSVNIVIVIFEHLLLRACISFSSVVSMLFVIKRMNANSLNTVAITAYC